MGNSYYRLGQYNKALECYENALSFENNASQGNTWFNMGLIYNQLKQYDKAIKCYEKAMEDKNYISLPNIWNELTRAYNKINQVATKQMSLQKQCFVRFQ